MCYFSGIVDEVVLYDRLLTESEIIAHFNAIIPAPCAADITGDGAVGPADLAQLLAAWGQCSSSKRARSSREDGPGAANAVSIARRR